MEARKDQCVEIKRLCYLEDMTAVGSEPDGSTER